MNLFGTSTLWGEAPDRCGGSDCHCSPCQISVGDGVTVSGFRGRGVVTKRNGRRLTVHFRSELEITRDQNEVHKI